jgi:general secretion pathway protein L
MMAAPPEAQSQRPPSAASRRAAHLWTWWRGEIVRLMPDKLGLTRGGGIPLLILEADEALVIDAHEPSTPAKTASLAGMDEGRRRAAVRSLLESIGETRMRARAVLRHDEALVRRVNLPAATEENLRQVLAFEMDRLSPFKADEVYFDYRVVSRDAANSQIVTELAMARRDIVDARVQQLRALGVSVQGVAVRDDTGRAATPFDLLPSEQRGERETAGERMLRNGLVAAVLLLFVAALFVPVWQKRQAVVAMLPAVEKARLEAQATDAIVRELERQAADYNYLLARRHAWYPMAAYVEEISKVLPDHTWLQQLDVKTAGKVKELMITGETASASKLIELMEQSKMIQNAAPRGPTTRGSVPGSERFMIAGDLRPRTPPEAQPMSVAAAHAPVVSPAPLPANSPPTATLGVTQPSPATPVHPAPPPPKAQPTPQSAPPPPSSGFGPFPSKQPTQK